MEASQSGQPALNPPCQVRLAGSTNKDPLSPHNHALKSWSQKALLEPEDTEVMSYERTAEWNPAKFNKVTAEISRLRDTLTTFARNETNEWYLMSRDTERLYLCSP